MLVKVIGHWVAQDESGNEYVQYRLRLSQGGNSREVVKRFSAFCDFASTLSFYEGNNLTLADLAPKKSVWLSLSSLIMGGRRSGVDPVVIKEREGGLEKYMNEVLGRKELRRLPFVQQFLGFALKVERKGLGREGGREGRFGSLRRDE